jgi:hypothetical protein
MSTTIKRLIRSHISLMTCVDNIIYFLIYKIRQLSKKKKKKSYILEKTMEEHVLEHQEK